MLEETEKVKGGVREGEPAGGMSESAPVGESGARIPAGESGEGAPRRRRRLPIALGIVGAAVVAVVVAFAILVAVDPWGDPRAKAGYYEGKSDAEIQADLNASVEWYSMQVSIAPFVVTAPGSAHLEGVNVENIAANHCDQKFTLSLKDTGEVLYESGAVRPGEYVPDIDIAHGFDEGEYVITAEFQGYEQQARLGGGGQVWGHDEFGSPTRTEVLLIVTDDEQKAVAAALDYLN